MLSKPKLNNGQTDKDFAKAIKDKALALGFAGCGIIKVEELRDFVEKLDARIEEFPETKPMLEFTRIYAEPHEAYPWAKSVIVCITRYGKYQVPANLEGIGKYYLYDHKLQQKAPMSQSIKEFESYLEELGIQQAKELHGITSGRWAAAKAGLGIIRKNNFFYSAHGSWVIIDTWLIDQELEIIETLDLEPCPEQCNKCIKACPTKALIKPYCLNMAACITRLTWGVRTLVPEALSEQMAGWVYGCDACQNACPHNKKAWEEVAPYPGLGELAEHISLPQLLMMDDLTMKEVLLPKFWFIQPDNFWLWKVNALRAMTNDFRPEYREHILRAAHDENEKISEMAQWAMKKLDLIN